MHKLEKIAEQIRQNFELRTALRDDALKQARQLTRACSLAIRAVHRNDFDNMEKNLNDAQALADKLRENLRDHPDLYYAGYSQDALKEFVEANVSCALIQNQALHTPEDLSVEYSTYLNGLAEVVGELRRRILDILRSGYSQEAERLLNYMDDIYSALVTMDFPDAITSGLRRQTDIVRNLVEKTRGDVTFSLRGEGLTQAIAILSKQLTVEQVEVNKRSGLSLHRDDED